MTALPRDTIGTDADQAIGHHSIERRLYLAVPDVDGGLIDRLAAGIRLRLAGLEIHAALVEQLVADTLVLLQVARTCQLFTRMDQLGECHLEFGACHGKARFVAAAVESGQRGVGRHAVADLYRDRDDPCIDLGGDLWLIACHDRCRCTVKGLIEQFAQRQSADADRLCQG